MHRVYQQIQDAVDIPGINIFDITATAIKKSHFKKIALLGTRYTMSDPFFKDAYQARGIDIMIPEDNDALAVNEIIFKELIHEIIKPESKAAFQKVVERLKYRGVEAVILGCTEIEWILKPEDVSVPLFDTTELHARAAADWLLEI
jgi:aspartate racemase